MRAEQAEVEEVEFIARSISVEVSRREELAETKKDLHIDKHDDTVLIEQKVDLGAVDLSIVTDEHGTVSSLNIPLHLAVETVCQCLLIVVTD